MIEFILASGNAHKAEELADLFDSNVLSVVAAPRSVNVEENGETYHENAFKKAKGYFDVYQKPVLADDSGLNIPVLPNELGIHSARFGGDSLSSREKNLLLLKKLELVDKDQRKAWFTCVLCFYLSHNEVFFFEGRVDGMIGYEIQGDKGFGYDPVFIPDEFFEEKKSLAQLPDWKQKNSHRARAVFQANTFFTQKNCQN